MAPWLRLCLPALAAVDVLSAHRLMRHGGSRLESEGSARATDGDVWATVVSASEAVPCGCPRLHLLDLGEEAFLRLRAEQGIFVEFHAFLGHLVGLLQRCQEEGGGRPGVPSRSSAGPPLTATFEPAPG